MKHRFYKREKNKILIAEDDFITCRSLEKNLKDLGYEIISATNGKDAWKALVEEDIRIAILDWVMPGINGVELCRKIRQEFRGENSGYKYIILITGKNNQEDIIQGLSGGADDYMIKPLNFHELKARIQNGERIIQLEKDRRNLTCTDSLTRLWNRNKIMEILDKELHRGMRHFMPTGLIKLDIDHLNKITQSYGKSISDKVLSEVSSRLKRVIRCYDEIGRYGEDEMLVILSNCSQICLKFIAERLRHSVNEKKIKTESGELNITISLGGISSESLPQATKGKLLQACDKALSLAKKRGCNCSVLAESSMIPVLK